MAKNESGTKVRGLQRLETKDDLTKHPELMVPNDGVSWSQLISAGIATIPGINAAANITWIGPTLLKLEQEKYPITIDQQTYLSAIFQIGMLLASIPAVYFSNIFGRKTTLLYIATAPFLLANILQTLSTGLWVLYGARLLAGIGSGIVAIAAPIYLNEISTPRSRGMMQTFQTLGFGTGAIIPYVIIPMFSLQVVACLTSIPLLICLIFSWCVVESPYYYLMHKQDDKAKKALAKLKHTNFEVSVVNDNSSLLMIIKVLRENSREFTIVALIYSLQSVSGFPVINTYSQLILNRYNVVDPHLAGIFIPVNVIINSMLLFTLMDKIPYKKILAVSAFATSLLLLLLSLTYLDSFLHGFPTMKSYMPFVSVILMPFTSGGLFSVGFVYLGLIFPREHSALASCIINVYNAFFAFMTLIVHNMMVNTFGDGIPFAVYAVLTCSSLLILLKFVPEVQGMTMEEVRLRVNKSATKVRASVI